MGANSSPTPVQVVGVGGAGTLAGVDSLAGAEGFCALLSSGDVDCWGEGQFGQLGDGTFYTTGYSGSATPVQVLGVGGTGTLSGISFLTAGYYGYSAVLTSGRVDCWGLGSNGQLGDGTFYTTGNSGSAIPVQVAGVGGTGTLSGVATVSGTNSDYCARLTSGGVDCWGYGLFGQLGNGTFYTTGNQGSATPVEVVGRGGSGTLSLVSSLASNESFDQCALIATGGVDCWGYGLYGQLGDGNFYTTGSQGEPIPVQVIVPAPFAPDVTSNPQSQTVMTGGTLTFSATASAYPSATVIWQESANGGASWTTVAGATSTTFTTGALTGSNDGWQVRAVFTNVAGSATTSAATITVLVITSIELPKNGSMISGNQWLDASASPGTSIVLFSITGGVLSNAVLATATPTPYGWLAGWDTTSVANGSYILKSEAYYSGGGTATSMGITVTVNNPPPTASVVLPSSGSTLSGDRWLDASASAGVTEVQYELTGGSLNHWIVATAAPTIYGWLASWNTGSVSNGTYSLQSVASYAGGVTGTSPPITITVAN